MAAGSEIARVLDSKAFQMAALRSDRTRVVWTIGLFVVLLAFALLRGSIVRLEGGQDVPVGLLLPFGLATIAYEALVLALLNGRVARSAPLPTWAQVVNVLVESLIPTLLVLYLVFLLDVGPHRALLAPSVALYFLTIIVSTLRLRPSHSVLAGSVAAIGYLLVTAYTFRAHPEPPGGTVFHPLVFVTWAVILFVSGLAAGAVAGQIRGHLAAALREAEERQRLQLDARHTLIFGLAKLAEYRDTDTGAHLERISAYAERLAHALEDAFDEIDDAWIETLRVAASMHDIGKVGIPDNVLQKPGRLTDEERGVIELHPGIGAETLGAIRSRQGDDDLLAMSEEIAIGHHERWDGTGYPAGTAGPEIGLAARIISVADVYDALTSARIYKPAFPHEKARDIIAEGRGTQFDPDVVDGFLAIEDEFDAIRARYADAGGSPPPHA